MNVNQLEQAKNLIDLAIDYDSQINENAAMFMIRNAVNTLNAEIGYEAPKPSEPDPSVIIHVSNRLRELDSQTGNVSVLQFAPHPNPDKIALILRSYNPNLNAEYPISDVCGNFEVENNLDCIKRIDVLFDELANALKQIYTIDPIKARQAGI